LAGGADRSGEGLAHRHVISRTDDPTAFAAIAAQTVGSFLDWLLSGKASREILKTIARGGHVGDGSGGFETDAQSGPDFGREKMRTRHRFSRSV
jgi:hypothetical protein